MTRSDDSSLRTAWRSPRAHACFWLVATIGVAVDLYLKDWAFTVLRPDEVRPFWDGVIEFRRSLNPGAVFGLGAGRAGFFMAASVLALGFVVFLFTGSGERQRWLHVALGMILAGAIGNLYDRAFVRADVVTWRPEGGKARVDVGVIRSDQDSGEILLGCWPDGDRPVSIAASEVIRARRQGVVRDFIRFVPDFPTWVPIVGGSNVWPWVFNVADSLLVIGVGILLIQFWFVSPPTPGRCPGEPLPTRSEAELCSPEHKTEVYTTPSNKVTSGGREADAPSSAPPSAPPSSRSVP